MKVPLRLAAALITIAALAIPAVPAGAAPPPQYYRNAQNNAAEALVIKVVRVNRLKVTQEHKRGPIPETHTHVEVEATIVKVERSKSGLKPNEKIRIRYINVHGGPPGAGPIPIVRQGETVPAFLKPEGEGVYAPAASSASFRPLVK